MVGANWNLLLHIRGKGASRFGPINLSDLAEQVSYRLFHGQTEAGHDRSLARSGELFRGVIDKLGASVGWRRARMIERFVTLIAARVMALCTGISALKFGEVSWRGGVLRVLGKYDDFGIDFDIIFDKYIWWKWCMLLFFHVSPLRIVRFDPFEKMFIRLVIKI